MQHEWETSKSNDVKAIVSAIVENDRTGKLPPGYNLLGVMLSKDQPRAYCVWEAESKSGLEGLLKSVNPPTRNSVQPFEILYGVSKASIPA